MFTNSSVVPSERYRRGPSCWETWAPRQFQGSGWISAGEGVDGAGTTVKGGQHCFSEKHSKQDTQGLTSTHTCPKSQPNPAVPGQRQESRGKGSRGPDGSPGSSEDSDPTEILRATNVATPFYSE